MQNINKRYYWEYSYPIKFLNSLKFNGVHIMTCGWEKGAPILLLWNINQSADLCNGVRLIITNLTIKAIDMKVIMDSHVGAKIDISWIIMQVTKTKWPFISKKRQFLVRLCYAMTINKSQG